MLKFYISLFICIISLSLGYDCCAQIPQPARPRDYNSRVTVDTASIKVIYSCKIRRVLHIESYSSDIQTLEFGKKYIKYYSNNAEMIDSLKYANKSTLLGKDNDGNYREGTYEDIFINYPQAGTMSVFSRFMKKNFSYTETIPKLNWNISSEVDTVLNYNCIKAYTSFRGRKWIAWFTMDIPLNYGPWKLSGLPGLILKAEDSDKYFSFEAVGITQNDISPMIIYDEPTQKCKREDILRMNDLRWKDSNYLIKITSGNEAISFSNNDFNNTNHNNSNIIIPQKELE